MKTAPDLTSHLSRRERQIMDVVYRLGKATVAEITSRLPKPPTDTAVRTMLRILEQKGYVTHEQDGLRHVYAPVIPADEANQTVLKHVVDTFFGGSRSKAMATLLDLPMPLSDEELDRLRTLIAQAKARG
jgi:predicted transcriptional regulator